jgi:hypothetical protein
MDDDFIARIGTFFLVLGVGATVLFVISAIASHSLSDEIDLKTEFDYLFWAVALIGFGALMRRRAAPPPPSGRFSGIRGMLARQKKDEKPQKK